ncbi:MAG: class II aldolase/adducin family protein [Acidobacteriota bacterium]
MRTDWEIRREISLFGKKIYNKGFVAASDGNISVRAIGDRFFITPAGSCLGSFNINDISYLDLNGNVLSGGGQPSSELAVHIEVYKRRGDINAVIHAHPPVTTAFSVAGEKISADILPEIKIMFGNIPTAHYATPGTKEAAEAIGSLIGENDIVVMDHHGVLCLGVTLEDAFFKLEKLEHYASTLLAAKQLGNIKPLEPEEIIKLERTGKQ